MLSKDKLGFHKDYIQLKPADGTVYGVTAQDTKKTSVIQLAVFDWRPVRLYGAVDDVVGGRTNGKWVLRLYIYITEITWKIKILQGDFTTYYEMIRYTFYTSLELCTRRAVRFHLLV